MSSIVMNLLAIWVGIWVSVHLYGLLKIYGLIYTYSNIEIVYSQGDYLQNTTPLLPYAGISMTRPDIARFLFIFVIMISSLFLKGELHFD